jgi:hypothetical protein
MVCGMEIPVSKFDAQGVGSALTYLRRYMLSAIIGVAPADDHVRDKDDDANAAVGRGSGGAWDGYDFNQDPTRPAPAFPVDDSPKEIVKPKVVVTPKAEKAEAAETQAPQPGASRAPSQAMIKRLFTIADEKAWNHDQIRIYMDTKWGLKSTKDLTRDQYDALVSTIESMPFPKAMVQGFEK